MQTKFWNELHKNVTIRTFLGFTLSGTLLWLTFHSSGLKWQNLTLKGEQWFFFFGAMAAFVLAVLIQSIRTKLIWRSGKIRFTGMQTYTALIIGNFYNCLLPGNLGEGVRAFYFSKKHQLPFTRSLAVVFTEKWIDAQLFVCLTIVLLIFKGFISHYILYAIICTAVIIILLAIFYYFIRTHRKAEKKLWLRILFLKKTGRFLFSMYWHVNDQIGDMRAKGYLVYFVLLSVTTLLLNMLQFWLLLKAAGVTAPVLGLYSSYFIAVSMMIIAFIPSAPSNIGLLHYGIYSTLIVAANVYGVKPDVIHLQSYALFSVYLHLSYIIPEIGLGVCYVAKERKTLFG